MFHSPVTFIVGPTSSGKSAVAVELAEKMNGEIISCDSMQIYRDMDTVTRAPQEALTKRAEHHLIRIIPPEEEFNAALYAEKAKGAISSVIKKGKVPIITGGTGLYMKALLDGIFADPGKDEELRARLGREARENGTEALYLKLKEIDPGAASKIHANDAKRIIRALEVYYLTGVTMTEKKTETEGLHTKFKCRVFGLNLDRKSLYARIENSVDSMFEEGVVEEVKRLRESPLSITAGKALGIREISLYLDGKMSLEAAKSEIKKNTRRYAKRQMTWFRADKRVEWIDADRPAGEVAGDILERIG